MTFEEFYALVIEITVKHYLPAFPEDDVRAFCRAEKQYIREMYEDRKASVESGEVTGYEPGASAAAYGLGMMY